MAETIISRPLLRVGQDAIGLRSLFELLLGRRIARVAVRVVLHRQLSIGRLQGRIGRIFGYAKNLIVVAFGHRTATLTSAGRSSLFLKL